MADTKLSALTEATAVAGGDEFLIASGSSSKKVTYANLLDTNSNILLLSKGADIASATALTLGTDGNYFDVTGTTTITSIGTTGRVGTVIRLHFDGILTLTHHATDLILPGGANITTAAGDEAEFVEYASGDFRCVNYSKASGEAVKGTDLSFSGLTMTSSTGTNATIPRAATTTDGLIRARLNGTTAYFTYNGTTA